MGNKVVGIDAFAKSLEDIVQRPIELIDRQVPKVVSKTVQNTAKSLRGELTEGIGVHEWSKDYRGGFSSHTERNGHLTKGEVGNKAKPGLVHLLEDGHATPTGRRTRAFKHMEPALEQTEDELVDRINRAMNEALGG